LTDDGTRFATLATTLPATYQSDLAALQQKLTALQATLAKDNETITNAAVQLLPGMATLGLAAAAAIAVDTEYGKVLVEKGFTMVKGVVDDVDKALAEQTQTIAEYKTTLTTLADEQSQLACFASIAAYVQRFANAAATASANVATLRTAWQAETDRLGILIATAEGGDRSSLSALVSAGAVWWSATDHDVEAILKSVIVAGSSPSQELP
jgi:hypothetical protein